MKRFIFLLTKIVLSAGSLGYVASSNAFEGLSGRIADSDWVLVTTSATLLLLQVFIGAWRWQLVARAFDISLPYRNFFQMSYISVFFTLFPFGMIGADIAKSWYLNKSQAKLDDTIHSVIVDRVISVISLCLIVIFFLPFSHGLIRADAPIVQSLFLVLIVFGLVFIALLIAPQRLHTRLRTPLFRRVLDLSKALRKVTLEPRHSVRIWTTSILAQFTLVSAMAVLFPALHLDAQATDLFLILPIVLFVAMIPLSVAGWGFREGAMFQFSAFLSVSAADAVSVSVVFGVLVILVAAGGCIPWLAYESEQA